MLLHSFKAGSIAKNLNLGLLELIENHLINYLWPIFAELQQAQIKKFGHETNFK